MLSQYHFTSFTSSGSDGILRNYTHLYRCVWFPSIYTEIGAFMIQWRWENWGCDQLVSIYIYNINVYLAICKLEVDCFLSFYLYTFLHVFRKIIE